MFLGMVLGIDVSKNTLDAALIKADEPTRKPRHKVFANNAAGHQQHNVPISATQPAGSVDCNRAAMAGFAAAYGSAF